MRVIALIPVSFLHLTTTPYEHEIYVLGGRALQNLMMLAKCLGRGSRWCHRMRSTAEHRSDTLRFICVIPLESRM